MQIILSHDIDHLYWKQHYFRDLSLPKHLYRHSRAWLSGKIDRGLLMKRMNVKGRMHRIPELIEFHKINGSKGTFFFGMNQALGLTYYPQEAAPWIKEVIDKGHDAGVHGIAYNNQAAMQKEFDSFKEISGLDTFGIRNHYLRMSGYTLERMNEVGYLFDTTIQGPMLSFKSGTMWEIPMTVMDASLVPDSQANQDLNEWQDATKKRMDAAQQSGVAYFVVNHHDTYFDRDTFPAVYDWYVWLMEEIKNRRLTFTTFRAAVNELNNQ